MSLNEKVDVILPAGGRIGGEFAREDVCVPIIEREAFRTAFPGTGNAYVRLRQGHWTLGCAFLVNPEVLVSRQGDIHRAFDARKSQYSMARLLGPGFLFRFLTRRLSVGQIETKCKEVLGCTGGAVYGCAPELAFDIDLPEEYRYASERMKERPRHWTAISDPA